MGPLLQALKTHGRVDVFTQHSLAGRKIAIDDALDRLSEKSLPKLGGRLRAGADCFLKVVCQRDQFVSCFLRYL